MFANKMLSALKLTWIVKNEIIYTEYVLSLYFLNMLPNIEQFYKID